MKRLLFLLAIATATACASAGFAATMSVSSWHLWAGQQQLTRPPAPCTVSGASTETYVNQSTPTLPSGAGSTIDALADAGIQRWAFVKFDLSSCNIPSTGGADSAVLRLYVARAPARNFTLTLRRVLGSWSSSLSWNGAQALSYAGTTDTTASGTATGWVSFTVTANVDEFIQGITTNNGWVVTASGTTRNQNQDLIQFASTSGGTNKPELVIDYEK